MTPYCRLRLVTGGTFVAGGGPPPNPWQVQFDDSSIALTALATVAGEFNTGSITDGVCVDYCFVSQNPYDASVWIEASAGAPLQVHVNGVITEYTASALVTLSLIRGFNLVRYIRSAGPVIASGKVFDGDSATWVSLYPDGADPFKGSGGGAAFSTGSTNV